MITKHRKSKIKHFVNFVIDWDLQLTVSEQNFQQRKLTSNFKKVFVMTNFIKVRNVYIFSEECFVLRKMSPNFELSNKCTEIKKICPHTKYENRFTLLKLHRRQTRHYNNKKQHFFRLGGLTKIYSKKTRHHHHTMRQ